MASLYYTGDETEINVNGEVMGNMEVRNFIRRLHRFPATFPDGDQCDNKKENGNWAGFPK